MSGYETACRLLNPRLGFAVVLVAALALVGCTSKLLVTSSPSGATVTVTDPGGRLLASGPSPLLAELEFSEKNNKTYTVEVMPTTLQAERYLPGQQTIDTAGYNALEEGADKSRTLSFTLEEKPYVPVPVVEVLLTPKGKWVGVLSKTRSFKDITEAGGAVPTLIVDFGENRGIQGLAISPEGDRLVYSEAVYASPLSALDAESLSLEDQRVYTLKGANLRAINIVGGGVQHITTEDFQDMFPSFSADGERILFSSNRRGDLLGILGIKANGRSGISDIYVNHRNGMVLKPTSAADGTVAFSVVNLDPVRQIVTDQQVWTHYGPNEFPTQITRGESPAISPEGQHIAFINPDDGNLWVIDPDGSNGIQLTSGANAIMKRYRQSLSNTERMLFDANRTADLELIKPFSNPSWSPDGRYILYTSMEGTDPTGRPNEDIWMMRADGTDKQQLTTNGSSDRFPLMSPDGKEIYFLSNRGESWSIWRIPFGIQE
ncbi:TolB family protein [Algisphaera agarilytica]|uniref:Tol biopolymer transport system component n=1 Tax=Algisphaera agarilytica TaxID=1385975 RepID=A0A7X0H7E1_9BACT|nr:PD40 domain-containing protein [Algisphaera agarilytica]MBB6430646.1 Tol biopolymer transport system component [Algisphaera agarilytica]